MKQTGVVFFYNLNSVKGRQIRMICLKLGLQIRNIDKEQYMEPIGGLAGVPGFALTGEVYTGEGFDDEMLLMKGFTNHLLDSFLREFRMLRLEPVALKAVLTESNCAWNSLELHDELVKEHQQMRQYEKHT